MSKNHWLYFLKPFSKTTVTLSSKLFNLPTSSIPMLIRLQKPGDFEFHMMTAWPNGKITHHRDKKKITCVTRLFYDRYAFARLQRLARCSLMNILLTFRRLQDFCLSSTIKNRVNGCIQEKDDNKGFITWSLQEGKGTSKLMFAHQEWGKDILLIPLITEAIIPVFGKTSFINWCVFQSAEKSRTIIFSSNLQDELIFTRRRSGRASIRIPRPYIMRTHLRIWNPIQEASDRPTKRPTNQPTNQPANAHRRADRLNLFSDKLINLYQLPLAAFSQLPNLLTLNRSVMRERPVWTTRDFTQTISTDDQWNMICMPRCLASNFGYTDVGSVLALIALFHRVLAV